jgi:hypothetical protein
MSSVQIWAVGPWFLTFGASQLQPVKSGEPLQQLDPKTMTMLDIGVLMGCDRESK